MPTSIHVLLLLSELSFCYWGTKSEKDWDVFLVCVLLLLSLGSHWLFVSSLVAVVCLIEKLYRVYSKSWACMNTKKYISLNKLKACRPRCYAKSPTGIALASTRLPQLYWGDRKMVSLHAKKHTLGCLNELVTVRYVCDLFLFTNCR